MSRAFNRAFLAATFCVAAILGTQCAFAARSFDTVSVEGRQSIKFEYRYHPTDLATTHGTRRVYDSLVRKAQRACSDQNAPLTDLHRLDRGCVAQLVDKVVTRIDSPALARLHGVEQKNSAIARVAR
jgi:UrcA family protein